MRFYFSLDLEFEKITHMDHRYVNGVYVIVHEATSKYYIGSTKDLYERRKSHVLNLGYGTHKNRPLQAAYDNNPTISIWGYPFPTREEAYGAEQRLIDKLRAEGKLFNLATDVRNPGSGYERSQEQREKMRIASTGRPMSLEHKARLLSLHLGSKRSEEHKTKIGDWRRGQKRPETELKNFIESRRNSLPFVEINGVLYRSSPDAAEALKIPAHVVNYRCQSLLYPTWRKLMKNQSNTQTTNEEPKA